MEPIIVRKRRIEYVFYSDRLVITKKHKNIHEINYGDIVKITYSPKFGFKTLLNIVFASSGVDPSLVYKTLLIYLNEKKLHPSDMVGIPRLSLGEVEKIKAMIPIPIEMV